MNRRLGGTDKAGKWLWANLVKHRVEGSHFNLKAKNGCGRSTAATAAASSSSGGGGTGLFAAPKSVTPDGFAPGTYT